MVTLLQVSCAVATPVVLVVVFAGQSRTKFGGHVIVGLVVSRTVMVCTAFVVLPQASVAVQVRAITLVPAQLLVTASEKMRVNWLQASCATATPVLLVVLSAGHSRTMLVGMTSEGRVVSRTAMVCTQDTELPHPSAAVQVRKIVNVLPQLLLTTAL